ncbi:MAG: hypothetical protein FJ297_05905 [Planctomycetes bacterium]|nr:hypothetical protein [Planctomycetota bacterium]
MCVHRGKYDFSEQTGKRLLVNVHADGPTSTSVLINIGRQSFSWQSPFGYHTQVQISELPTAFAMYDDSFVFELDEVRHWSRWVPSIREAIGDTPIGSIQMGEKRLANILQRIQGCARQVDQFSKTLDCLNIDTELYRIFLASKSRRKTDAVGSDRYVAQLLEAFTQACDVYRRVPAICEPDKREIVEDADKRKLIAEMQRAKGSNPLSTTWPVEIVDYEVMPLNINWFNWRGQLPGKDIRTVAFDLLLGTEPTGDANGKGANYGSPLVTEVKLKNDQWTSSALTQAIFYGALLVSSAQKARFFRDFCDQRPWVCVLAQDRNPAVEAGFAADYQSALEFLKRDDVSQTLKSEFGGAFVILMDDTRKALDEHRFDWS